MYIHITDVHNTKAAEVIVPLLLNFIKPKSVIDIGCGIGTWLKVFAEHIGNDYLGVDGNYVDRNLLTIPEDKFYTHDLRTLLSLNRKFDLVVSLEVAEHLPEDSADIFVNTLSALGDYILFSAAIPGQGGQNHLNEQWPEYWIKKFEHFSFKCYDIIRPLVWNNPNVDLWYKQNILFFTKNKIILENDLLYKTDNFAIVHPEMFKIANNRYRNILDGNVSYRQLISIINSTIKKRILKIK